MHPCRTNLLLLGALAATACGDLTTAPGTESAPPAAGAEGPAAAGLSLYGIGSFAEADPRPCPGPEHRDFDFWIGDWEIERDGAPIATSVVRSDLGGCVIMEDFVNVGGVQARSISMYERATDTWHQSYQDNVLGNFRLSGQGGGGVITLSGVQRIYHFGLGTFVKRDATSTWTRNADGTVRQRIEGSFDEGPVQVLFDGLYRPSDALDRAQPSFFPFCQLVLPGFRELDFWIGAWRVGVVRGPHLGESRVISDLNGCLLQEDFEGRNGYRSRSFLFWDFAEDRWFRTFTDTAGKFLRLSGEWDGARMILTGTDQAPDGAEVQVRNIIEPAATGVRHTWEISTDGGATWQTSLEMVYESG